MKDGDAMIDELIKEFPNSGQKIVSLVKSTKFGVCIKKIQKNVDYISRINKEINIQKQLNCIYYPKVYYSEITEDSCLIYEEFIDGNDLTDYVGIEGIYYDNEVECIKLLKELIIGLDFVWQKNVVHRDIKPANIIIRKSNNKPVILDLGIAKNLDSNTVTTGGMWGTRGYSSPEQRFNNRDLFGKRSDMFSLGIVIYELFYGEIPFKNDYELAFNSCDFNKNNLEPSEEFKSIISKMLEKQPFKRYKNALSILNDINKYLGGVENE